MSREIFAVEKNGEEVYFSMSPSKVYDTAKNISGVIVKIYLDVFSCNKVYCYDIEEFYRRHC